MIALKSMVPLQSAEVRCPLECINGRYKRYGKDGREEAEAGRVSVMRAINGGGGFHGGGRFVGFRSGHFGGFRGGRFGDFHGHRRFFGHDRFFVSGFGFYGYPWRWDWGYPYYPYYYPDYPGPYYGYDEYYGD